MSIRKLKGGVTDKIPVENVLVSVSDKSGLEKLVHGLIGVNPNIKFISTGGTYRKLKDILSDNHTKYSYESNLIEVAKYTGFPEMPGDLVKTLHPKIHAGLLGERNNPEHHKYLAEILDGGLFIDLAVVNLYPFKEIIGKIKAGEIDKNTGKPYNFESARGNIDIGGPAMIRAAAKNFPSCAVASAPSQYENIIEVIKNNDSSTTFDIRLQLAKEAFKTTAEYENSITLYLSKPESSLENVRKEYNFVE